MARRRVRAFNRILYEPEAELQPEALSRVYDRLFAITAARLTGTHGSPSPLPGKESAELDSAALLRDDAGVMDTIHSLPQPQSSVRSSPLAEPLSGASCCRAAAEEGR